MPRPDCIVDTCIWIYEYRGNRLYDLYKSDLEGKILGVSFQVYAELVIKPTSHLKWHRKFDRERLATIVYPDEETCRLWGVLINECKAQKRMGDNPHMDMWQAATALRYQVPLVTHNKKHFVGFPNLQLICHDTPDC